jgi:hypothetical protein
MLKCVYIWGGGGSVYSYNYFCHFCVPRVMYNFGLGIWLSRSKYDSTIPQNLKSHVSY